MDTERDLRESSGLRSFSGPLGLTTVVLDWIYTIGKLASDFDASDSCICK